MTDNIQNYAFDFGAEIPRLQRELDWRADHIVFVNIDHKVSYPKALLRHLMPKTFAKAARNKTVSRVMAGKQVTAKERMEADEFARWLYTKKPDETPATLPLSCTHGIRCQGVFINNDTFAKNIFGTENADVSLLFGLYHETGHALMVERKKADELHPYSESAADAYAALRLLQRFGADAKSFLSITSWQRAFYALFGETSHLSTPVLDKIIADSATRDFSKLSAGETLELAKDYATQWTPTVAALSAARSFFKPTGNLAQSLGPLLDSTCLSSSSHDLAFLIGAKVAQPFLQHGEITCNGAKWKIRAEGLRECATAIDSRLVNMRLSGLFNAAANPAAVQVPPQILPVILPPSQKQLVFNPR